MWHNKVTINTAIVIASAKGILKSMDRTRLSEYGGPATLTECWAKSLLNWMNFTKWRGTTKASMPIEAFNTKKSEFLKLIFDIVTMEEIPGELIFNWDQTGINLVPASSWTMDVKGSKRVEIKGRQATNNWCVLWVTYWWVFANPINLWWKNGPMSPTIQFPSRLECDTHNHRSTEQTMLEYIQEIIVPFVERVRSDLGKGEEQAGLAIFDSFRGQLTMNVTKALEKHNIQTNYNLWAFQWTSLPSVFWGMNFKCGIQMKFQNS